MKTSFPKPAAAKWYLVDAENRVLGRLATKIATVIRGKHRPTYVPHLLCGDHVVVINAGKSRLTGRKSDRKSYFHHTGYFGGLKEIDFTQLMEKDAPKALTIAVRRMLPKNASRDHTLQRLHVYAGPEHTHTAAKPQPLPL